MRGDFRYEIILVKGYARGRREQQALTKNEFVLSEWIIVVFFSPKKCLAVDHESGHHHALSILLLLCGMNPSQDDVSHSREGERERGKTILFPFCSNKFTCCLLLCPREEKSDRNVCGLFGPSIRPRASAHPSVRPTLLRANEARRAIEALLLTLA